MGTFAHYSFPDHLIPEKKKEYIQRALDLCHLGGLMGFEPIKTPQRWAHLLKPYPLRSFGKYDFTYSYFEKRYWENAYLDPENGDFKTNKVGYSIFGQVCYAVYLLREFYEVISGIVSMDGSGPYEQPCLGWFKYLFGGEWNNHRIYRIQKLYCHYPNWWRDYYEYGDRPTKAEYDALMTAPIKTSDGIDRKIFLRMTDDGVCSSDADDAASPISTLDFLNANADIRLMLPLKGQPGMIEDDDRIFWWKPGGDVVLSKTAKKMLSVFRDGQCQFLQDGQETEVKATLMRVLADGTEAYNRAFLFEPVYWEFVKNHADRNVQAATRLLDMILNVDLKQENPTLLDAYCAVLANKALRKEVLGF